MDDSSAVNNAQSVFVTGLDAEKQLKDNDFITEEA